MHSGARKWFRLGAAALPLAVVVAACGSPASVRDAAGLALDAQPCGFAQALQEVSPAAFARVAQTGVTVVEHPRTPAAPIGQGAAVGDVDGDGRPDIILARAASETHAGGAVLLLNRSRHTLDFVEHGKFSALVGDGDVTAVALGDYDRDADLDVFLARPGPDQLLRNDGFQGFRDVTVDAGVAGPTEDLSSGALWADFDNDGALDLYVMGFLMLPPWEMRTGSAIPRAHRNRLYLNRGGGRFEDVAEDSGLDDHGATHAAQAVDLDADGRLELLVANDRFSIDGKSSGLAAEVLPFDRFYARDEDAAFGFTDLAPSRGFQRERSSMGIALHDFDGDGAQDIYITDYGANDLLSWDAGSMGYRDVAASLGVALGAAEVGWGAVIADLDGNGSDELLVVNGTPPDAVLDPGGVAPQRMKLLCREPGVRTFGEVDGAFAYAAPLPQAAGLRGVYPADFDGDGDRDFLVGAIAARFRLLRNDAPRRGPILRVRLEGTVSAADPVGARASAVFESGERVDRLRVSGGETYGHGEAVLEFGLGPRALTHLEVRWPSGVEQRLEASSLSLSDVNLVVEPRWLQLSDREVTPDEPAPTLSLHADGEGSGFEVIRSDGMNVSLERNGNTYSALLERPTQLGEVQLLVLRDGVKMPTSPVVRFR